MTEQVRNTEAEPARSRNTYFVRLYRRAASPPDGPQTEAHEEHPYYTYHYPRLELAMSTFDTVVALAKSSGKKSLYYLSLRSDSGQVIREQYFAEDFAETMRSLVVEGHPGTLERKDHQT